MLARLDAGPLEVANSPVTLRALVEDCWRPYAATAADRGLALRLRVPEDAAAVTDRDKLRVVVSNLIANAVEYTDAGGWIEIATGDGTVLDVIDSGPPIPADQLERIFDRMWRSDAARTATGVHCGIGLSLARSLAGYVGMTLGADLRGDGAVRFRLAYSSSTNAPFAENVASLRALSTTKAIS